MTITKISVCTLADNSYEVDKIIVHCLESSRTVERSTDEEGRCCYKFWDMRDWTVSFFTCHERELEIWAWLHEGSYQEGGFCRFEEERVSTKESV